MTRSKTILAALTALTVSGFASVASAAPLGNAPANAGVALTSEAGGSAAQKVFFYGGGYGRHWGGYGHGRRHWGGPRVYSYYYAPRRWYGPRRHWRGW